MRKECFFTFTNGGRTVLNALLLFANTAYVVFGIKIALAVIALVCTVFIICVVLMQSGNSDGMEAISGSSKSDDSETYYGKNASSRRDAKLKLWTYICSGVLAVCCIVFIILSVL